MEYTDDITRQFYGNVQTVVNNWLLFDGMSIGVADTIANDQTTAKISQLLDDANDKVTIAGREFTIFQKDETEHTQLSEVD